MAPTAEELLEQHRENVRNIDSIEDLYAEIVKKATELRLLVSADKCALLTREQIAEMVFTFETINAELDRDYKRLIGDEATN